MDTIRRYTAAVAQLTSTDNLRANLAVCLELAQQASDRGARLFSLPECFCFLGASERDKMAVAETLDHENPGPILEALIAMATTHNMWVSGAGIPEIAEQHQSEAAYNSHVVVDPSGRLVATYRKIHLFDVDIPNGPRLKESAATLPGVEVVAPTTELGTLGLATCYDLRFPELFQELTIAKSSEILLIPAAFTATTGSAHWHVLLRARAIETQTYVLAAAQTGAHNSKRSSYGHSVIIDPWGEILAEIPDNTGVACAEVDLNVVAERRAQMPIFAHKVLR